MIVIVIIVLGNFIIIIIEKKEFRIGIEREVEREKGLSVKS